MKTTFLEEEDIPPPKQSYKITVSNTGQVIEVDHKSLPEGEEGREGSLLSILLAKGVELDHTCGGVVACSTCHIYVTEGGDTAPESSEAEEDQLEAPQRKQSIWGSTRVWRRSTTC